MRPKTAKHPGTHFTPDVARPGGWAGAVPALDYIGDPGACDVCGRPLADEVFFCDAELPAHGGQWGVLCRICTVGEGIRAGWGNAQFYERQEPEPVQGAATAAPAVLRWRCVVGNPPADEADN